MPLVIPENALREAGLSEREALIEFACHLFATERLALWSAARLAGLSRVAFEEELGKRNIAIYRPKLDDLREDLQRLDRLGI